MSTQEYQLVDTPDGEVEFPIDMPDEQIRALLSDEYGTPEQETPVSDFLSGIKELPKDAANALLTGVQDYSASPTDDPALGNPVTAAANIARPLLKVGELVSDIGIDAWKSTWGQHPLINNEVVRQSIAGIKDSSIANWAMTALGKGYDAWMDFEEKNPATAQMLKDTGVVTEVFTPKVGTPVTQARTRRLLQSGNKDILAQRKAGIQRLIEPETKVGEGETLEADGVLRRKEYVPSDREDSIIEAMSIEDSIDPNRSFTYNNMEARKAARKLNKETNKAILKAGNPSIDRPQLMSDIQEVIDNMDEIPGYHSLTGDARKFAEDYYKEIQSIMGRTKGSKATHILKARQEFDKYVNQGAKVFDPNRESAKQVAARHIRDVLNQSVKDSVPGDVVHDLLNRQHQLLSGSDILTSKVAKEAESTFARIFHKLREYGHLPATPLGLYATATAGAALVGGGVGAAAMAGLGGAAYLTFKGMKPSVRKVQMARLLQAMDKQKGDFAAERVYLLELMKATEEEEQAQNE